MGYVEPTPIQLRAIPLILAGQDVIGSAQTGTGKTAAFALPILSRLGQHSPQTRVLVLEPTRELAAQVETAIHDFARFTNLRTAVVFGGVGYGKQKDALKQRRGYPGGHARPAARPHAAGHLPAGPRQVPGARRGRPHARHGLSARRAAHPRPLPARPAHVLFSATIPPEIETLIQWAMRNPQTVEIGLRRSPKDTVKHVIYPVADSQKTDLVLELLKRVNYDR